MSSVKNSLRRLFSNRTKAVNRSKSGNLMIFLFIGVIAAYSIIPLLLLISNSLKQYDYGKQSKETAARRCISDGY